MSILPIPSHALRWRTPRALLDFTTTAELVPEADPVGQESARAALRQVVSGSGSPRHCCVSMPSGVAGPELVADWIRQTEPKRRSAADLVYLCDLDDPLQPLLLTLSSGRAEFFRRELSELLTRLLLTVPLLMSSPVLEQTRSRGRHRVERARRAGWQDLARRLAEMDMLLVPPAEAGSQPVVRLRLGEQDFDRLELQQAVFSGELEAPLPPDDVWDRFEEAEEALRELEGSLIALVSEVEAQGVVAEKTVLREGMLPPFAALGRRVRPARQWLNRLADYCLDRYWFFHESAADAAGHGGWLGWHRVVAMASPWRPGLGEEPAQLMAAFEANVVHRAPRGRRAPVVLCKDPNYGALLGGVVLDSGQNRRPDWLDLRGGQLLEAQGGFLVIPLRPLLANHGAWAGLKRVLRDGQLGMQNAEVATQGVMSLKPQSIPLDVTVVLVGEPGLCTWLHDVDAGFREIFREKVEFESSLPLASPRAAAGFPRHIAALLQQERLPHATADAVAALMEWTHREADEPEALSLRHQRLREILVEASSLAQDGLLHRAHVDQAIAARRGRQDLAERRLRRTLSQKRILVETHGQQVAVINALAVFRLANHTFGRPLRVTAAVGVGRREVVNIEREAGLSGNLHDKGVQILGGYLRHVFGRRRNLALTASICVEQSYGHIDGDSATCAELLALISALGCIPLRQDLAVTGSMDQHGRVQAIGGVNTKIESHFFICREQGLTGGQGVVIPAGNASELQLAADVVAASEQGLFSIWPVQRIEQAITLFTGMEAGVADEEGRFPEGTVFAAVAAALDALQAVARPARSPS